MNQLERLPEVAEKSLGGLTAGQDLKYRIKHAACEGRPTRQFRIPAWVPAVCCALVLAVGILFALPYVTQTPADLNDAGVLTRSQRAGEATDAPRMRSDLPDGAVQLTASRTNPSYRSIWAAADGGSFPLIGVNGRYYRLMSNPTSVGSGLLGESLGTVAEFSSEPALSGNNTMMSNCVSLGENVYTISGMQNAAVAAKIDGVYRVFQRVSFNGHSVRSSESLADTLQISGHVLAMELSGVGTITDSSTANGLISTLLNNACFESSGTVSGRQSLLIQLDNGLTLQMTVKDDKLGACGTWSCPEFIDAFEAAVK